MSSERITPTDHLTGLPLPVLPKEPHNGALSLFVDYHHHFHPKESAELSADTVGGKALRYSRGQIIPRNIHKTYHNLYDGPEIPADESRRFLSCVLACAGVVPRSALDLRDADNPKVVSLTDKEHRQIASTTMIESMQKRREKFEVKLEIGRFFARYAIKQHFAERVREVHIEEFLDERTKPQRKQEIGNLMVASALCLSAEEVTRMLPELRSEGYIHETSSVKPLLVIGRIFKRKHFADYHELLTSRLLGTEPPLEFRAASS